MVARTWQRGRVPDRPTLAPDGSTGVSRMTWEHLPQRSVPRRWLPVASVAMGVLLLVVVAGGVPPGAVTTETIPVEPLDDAERTAGASTPAVDPSSFEPRPLPLEEPWTRPRIGANLLPGAVDGLTIIATDHRGVWTANTATGWVQRTRLPEGATPATAGGLWVSDDAVVFNTSATVLRLSTTRRLQTFATAHRTIDTIGDDAVWVFRSAGRLSGGTASRVSLDGEVLDQVNIPAVATPFIGTDDQLLVSAAGAISRIATDGTRALIARGEAIASNGTQLAWVQCEGDLSCAVVLGTVDAPNGVRVPFPPTGAPLAGRSGRPVAAFSPDGRWLALPLYDATGAKGQGAAIMIAFIDVATGGEVHRARGPRANPFESPLAWSPDSRWLIFGSDTGISAWEAGTRETRTLDLGFGRARDLAVRPSSP